jgi:hypothetical protein
MNKFSVGLLLVTGLLAGCIDQTKTYSCVDANNPNIVQSLSIKKGLATWGSVNYKGNCGVTGNKTTFGFLQEDCITSTKGTGDFLTLQFDEITGEAISFARLGNGSNNLTAIAFRCKKIDK